MVWFVQPRQRKSDMMWQLVAESDEGGGFHPCCDHPHATADEAQTCDEAKREADAVTGVPCTSRPIRKNGMTEAQIKHMASRFLSWKLPDNFNPDGGISFERDCNAGTPWPSKREPVGTNLLDAAQAEAMVRHLVEGLPQAD